MAQLATTPPTTAPLQQSETQFLSENLERIANRMNEEGIPTELINQMYSDPPRLERIERLICIFALAAELLRKAKEPTVAGGGK